MWDHLREIPNTPMITPPLPADEASRLESLRSLNILDTSAEERFDRLTRLAKRLFDVPIALISLVDANRQWFKSCQGLGVSETPREVSFCGHAILDDVVMMIPDALLDERFRDNPLVTDDPKIRFYAGCPLRAPGGSKIGTFCVIDQKPRNLDEGERELLRDLARMAEREIAAVQLATMDELTLLSNRRGFMALSQHSLSLCARLDRPASLLFFDLDGFKSINDRFGHAEGDRALGSFAAVLMKTFRDSDVVGRLGGDEFVVLITNCTTADSKLALDRLNIEVDAFNRDSHRGYEIRFSVGAIDYDPSKYRSLEALLGDADALMYEHKRRMRAT
jgi:diguanylate cyclase (GGDEF)-like protein